MVYPRTSGQREYLQAMRKNDIVFGVGPAGTGKTYMAVAMGLHYFFKGEIKKIILTRPAIEAGERLGFLPGDLVEKVNPYLRPLYDAIHDMIDIERADRMIDKGEIEIAPLAFMRGRTLNDAYVILDEAQNATKEQMKMFLTRLGFQSKCIVTGDTSQVDLPKKHDSGLFDAIKRLQEIEGISIHQLTSHDVVRHHLVQKIIEAYD
jgi:phosphate starvation-inducible PhoH-like protein